MGIARYLRRAHSPARTTHPRDAARRRFARRLEELEPRLMMAVAAEEQLFVYLVNRARNNPVAYQQEYNLPVDLSYVTPRGPLAVNDLLFNSAEFHATEMATFNYFGHQSAVTGDWPNKMARDAGYVLPGDFPNNTNNIESLAAGTFYSNAATPLNALIVDAGIPDLGHRNHLLGIDSFNAGNREIGVGHAYSATAEYSHYWAIHATRTNPNDRFLTGVVFNDVNSNGRYDLNEGLGGVTVSAGGGLTTATNAAGGWSIKVGAGTYTVMATGAGYVGAGTASATVSTDNVEVDFISGRAGGIVNFNTVIPGASINDVTVTEGSGNIVNAVFTVTLSETTTGSVTISYSTAGATATADTDFASQSGVLSFAPGTLSRTITVAVSGDLLDEASESFAVNLTGAIGATLTDANGVGLIIDNDDVDPQPNNIMVVAPGPGRPAQVRVLDRASGAEKFSFLAYNAGFQGGVQVATGDVTGDGVLDIIVGAGAGGGPHVRVIDGATGNEAPGPAGSFFAYNIGFAGGVFVAAGDIDGDSRADIITGAGQGGGPHVRIFSGMTGALIGEYFAYNAGFLGGVRVAVGDVDGNGTRDVITAPGPGGGPHVRVFSGASQTEIASFFVYNNFTGGVYVAAGDIDGDSRADIITGPGFGGGPHVRAMTGAGVVLADFFAYAGSFTGGVRVAAGDFNGNNRADIITAAGNSGGPHVRVFEGQSTAELLGLFAYEGSFAGGLYVAGSPAGMSEAPLAAATTAETGAAQPPLTLDRLELIRAAAITRWEQAGLGADSLERLNRTEVRLGDLPGNLLGLADGVIIIDANAAEHGWFVDPTPWLDEEFGLTSVGDLVAAEGAASVAMDLLTVLVHELGHMLELDHLDAAEGEAMHGQLPVGTRRNIAPSDAERLFAVWQ